MTKIVAFRLGQRVFVSVEAGPDRRLVCAKGRVARICSDRVTAWVALDKRSSNPDVHPFPATDATRATHVLVRPEDCEALT